MEIIGAVASFTRWLRVSKNLEALTASLHEVVVSKMQVVNAPRPKDYNDRAEALVNVLFRAQAATTTCSRPLLLRAMMRGCPPASMLLQESFALNWGWPYGGGGGG